MEALMAVVLDTNIVPYLAEGELNVGGLHALKNEGTQTHMAEGAAVELTVRLFRERLPWARWNRARRILQELLCRGSRSCWAVRSTASATCSHRQARQRSRSATPSTVTAFATPGSPSWRRGVQRTWSGPLSSRPPANGWCSCQEGAMARLLLKGLGLPPSIDVNSAAFVMWGHEIHDGHQDLDPDQFEWPAPDGWTPWQRLAHEAFPAMYKKKSTCRVWLYGADRRG